MSAWALLKETYGEWSSNKAPRLAAALAFYTLFAMGPLLVVIIQIGALLIGLGRASGHHHQLVEAVTGQLNLTLGPGGTAMVMELVQNTVDKQGSGQGLFSGVVGWVLLAVAAGGLFGTLQDALNTVWEIKSEPYRGWLHAIRERFASFALIAGLAFVLVISLACNALIGAFGQLISELLPAGHHLIKMGNMVITFALATTLFALIFKYLPDTEIHWRDVWAGAALTSLLLGLGQTLLSLYIAHNATASTYGAASSVVALLIWVYYSAQIMLFGAEFTRVYAHRCGSRPDPLVGHAELAARKATKTRPPRQEVVHQIAY